MATECGNKNHSAAYPERLPEWFIKLFTKEGDWVLDPFVGSGTTSLIAQRLRRHSLGIEIKDEYYREAIQRLKDERKIVMPITAPEYGNTR